MRIGEAATLSGASVRALRFYEDEGLITPGRCSNGYRDYCRPTIDRIVLVRSLLDSGLPVRLIRDALRGVGDGSADGVGFLDEVRRYRDGLAARVTVLDARRAALDAFLREASSRGRMPD